VNIVLIGYRGTGKSTVARLLGKRLGRRVVSTDGEVIGRANLSIPKIVEQGGWDHFRNLESAVCQSLTDKDELVIDTGGGVILRDENVAALKANGVTVWLTAEVPTIASRIRRDTQRPSLSGTKTFVEEIEEILQAREPKYKAAADYVIPTDQFSPKQITDLILKRISI
jgi:shikimate kinase